MKENLMVVCYDYGLARRVSRSLAEFLDMRFFDMFDMFRFDNAPNSLTDIIKNGGTEYALKKMRSVFKTELDISGAVFVAEPKMLGLNQDLYEKLKACNLVLYLKSDYKDEYVAREKVPFNSSIDKEFFKLELDEIFEIGMNIDNNLADIVIEIDGLNFEQVKEKVIKTLESFAG